MLPHTLWGGYYLKKKKKGKKKKNNHKQGCGELGILVRW